MKVAIGTDHNGSDIKNHIIKYLENKNIEVLNIGEFNNQLDDYPDFAFVVSNKIIENKADLGILICGTGIGMCIAANKVKGIRCAHVSNVNEASLSKEHNDANIIALSSKHNINDIIKMIDIFINSEFKNEERHIRRIKKINKFEQGEYSV